MTSPFSDIEPDLQIAWDSTSLGWLKTCPRLYYYKMIRQKEPKGAKQALVFGQGLHSGAETYDHQRLQGASHGAAQREALRRGLQELGEYHEEVVCPDCGSRNIGAIEGGGFCYSCYEEILPARRRQWYYHDLDGYHCPESLARAIVWYTEQYRDDPMETLILPSGKPALELSFTAPTGIQTQGGEEIILCGHIDRAVRDQSGNVWITDRKTAKQALYQSYFDKYTPDNQMSLYTVAGQLILPEIPSGVMIDAIQKAVNFTRLGRGYAPRSKGQMQEFLEDLQTWVLQAELYAKLSHWPMNDKSCDMYGGCPFRKICDKDPEVRDKYLSGPDFQDFVWNPLDRR